MRILIILLFSLSANHFAMASGESGEQEPTKVFDYEKSTDTAIDDDDGLGAILDDNLSEIPTDISSPIQEPYSYTPTEYADNNGVYEFCATEFQAKAMNDCIESVKGHLFTSATLEVCRTLKNSEKLECLSIVKNRDFEPTEEFIITTDILDLANANQKLSYCTDEFPATAYKASYVIPCLKRMAENNFSKKGLSVCSRYGSSYDDKLLCLDVIKNASFSQRTKNVCVSSSIDTNMCIQSVESKNFESEPLSLCQESAPTKLVQCLAAIEDRSFDDNALSVCSMNANENLVDCLALVAGERYEPAVQICRKNNDPLERTFCTESFRWKSGIVSDDDPLFYFKIADLSMQSIKISLHLFNPENVEKLAHFRALLNLTIKREFRRISKTDTFYVGLRTMHIENESFRHYNKNDYWKTSDEFVEKLIPIIQDAATRGVLYDKVYY